MNNYRLEVMLCAGTGCVSCGSFKIKETLEDEIKKKGLDNEVRIVQTGCNGLCEKGPLVLVMPGQIFYCNLKKENIPHLVEEHFLKGRPVKNLMYTLPK